MRPRPRSPSDSRCRCSATRGARLRSQTEGFSSQSKPPRTATQNQAPHSRRIAILATDGFEQIELTGPRDALQAAGHRTEILAPKPGTIQGFHHDQHGDKFEVSKTLADAQAQDCDALLLPGGVMNGDALRTDKHAQALVQAMDAAGQPIALICHGGWLLIDAGVARGRTVTSWSSLATDFKNAGATWVDEEVHRDGTLISSRKPDDIPAFNQALVEALQKAH